jgi:hypothetical protein
MQQAPAILSRVCEGKSAKVGDVMKNTHKNAEEPLISPIGMWDGESVANVWLLATLN